VAISCMISVIVFDFDGVIVQSNRLKYDAFFEIFDRDAALIIEEILREYREETRHRIIERILSKWAKKTVTERQFDETVESYVRRYNEIVEEGAITCPEIPGAERALEILSKHFRLYINSTTPLGPLMRILQKRRLGSFFKGVYGGEESKVENLMRIMKGENIGGCNCLVIGDGISDFDSARQCDCQFIGVRNEFEPLPREFTLIDTLRELPCLVFDLNKGTNREEN